MLGRCGRTTDDRRGYCAILDHSSRTHLFVPRIKQFCQMHNQRGSIFNYNGIDSRVNIEFDDFVAFQISI